MDYETERVLLEKSSNIPTAPASMSKLMTIYLAFEALKQENILPASAMSPNYKYVVFICDGCFETHLVDEVEHILCASPTKFFFKCSGENYYGTKKTEGGFHNLHLEVHVRN